MAESPEEFNCEMDPGIGVLLDGFTAGFDLMIEPFQIALALAIPGSTFLVDFPELAALGPPKIAIMFVPPPGLLMPEMALKFEGKLPGFGFPLPDLPDIDIPVFDPTVTIDFALALIGVPFKLLTMAIDLEPPDLAVDLPKLIAEIPGLDINAAINLSGCVMAIVEGAFPLEPHPGDNGDEEEEEGE